MRTRLLLAIAALFALGGTARAGTNLSPFGKPRALNLDPVRTVAQATPAPAAACKKDADCAAGTICEDGTCRAFERATNILLFRKEGPSTAFLPFYFSRRGSPGHRVIVPFYWHFWSSEDKAKIVAPFYWHFEDHVKQRFVTVVGLYSHTRQPDAQSWAVWPFFYRSTKFGWAAPLLGSFKIANPDEGKAMGLYGFLYFWKRAPGGRAFDLGFPLFVSKRSDASAFTFALPLNFYWRSGEEKHLLALPLLYRSWDRENQFALTPIGYGSSAPGNAEKGAIFWLYWFSRQKASQYDVLFPVLWSFRSPASNTTVLPPLLHLRRGASSFTTVFPLWWSAKDTDKGSGWKLLLPVYFSRTSAEGKRHMWLTPLGGYKRDDDKESRALTFIVPPIFWRKNAQYELESYLLLYWKYRSVASGASTTVVGPFYGRDDPQGSTRVGFPFYWSFRDAQSGATAHTFFPFYFRRNGTRDTTTAVGLFPMWVYHRRFAEGGTSNGLFPLVFFGSRGDKSHAVVFPLFWHFASPRGSSTLALPVFYRFTDQHHASTGVLPLLFFQGRDHQARYTIQIPFFWRFSDGEKKTATTVVPPFFYRSRPDGWSAGVFPLLFAGGGDGKKSHFVLFPFVWRFRDDKRTTTVALNYLHRTEGPQTTDALFPLFHYRRGGADTSFTLLPLVHYRRTATTSTFVSPLAAWTRTPERKAGVIIPYFWYQSARISASGVPPLYFDVTRHETGERTRLIGPYFQLDAPGQRTRALFPLWAHYKGPSDSGTFIFPTYFRRRTDAGYRLDTIFPLYWRSTWPGHSTTVVGPFFHHGAPDGHSTGLLPLFVYSTNAHRRFLATLLFVRHSNFDTGTTRTFSPLYFSSYRRDGYTSVFFPLWWAGGDKTGDHRVFFPLYWHFGSTRENWSFNLAGPLLWSHNGSRRTRGLMPIAWYSRDEQNGVASNAVLPLFYERHGRADRMVLTLPFGFRSAPDRGWFYAGPFVYKNTWNTTFWTLFPLWFSHTDKVTEAHTRVVPPLLHYSRSSPERSLWTAALLFWRHRDITSSTTLGLPLFYDVHSFHQSRVTLLLPLFFRYRSDTSGNTYTFAPLFYRRSSAEDATTVAFPLVWDFKGSEKRTTIVFPFYAGFRRPNWQGRYIFPNVWYRTGLGTDAGTSRFFFFPLWESAVKRPGDYMWEALLGLVGWERIGRNRFLKLFFIPFELEPAPAARTAWYGRTPRPTRQRAKSLSPQLW